MLPIEKPHPLKRVNVQIETDPNCNALYLYLDPYHNVDKKTIEVKNSQFFDLVNGQQIGVDFDAAGGIIGIELLR